MYIGSCLSLVVSLILFYHSHGFCWRKVFSDFASATSARSFNVTDDLTQVAEVMMTIVNGPFVVSKMCCIKKVNFRCYVVGFFYLNRRQRFSEEKIALQLFLYSYQYFLMTLFVLQVIQSYQRLKVFIFFTNPIWLRKVIVCYSSTN